MISHMFSPESGDIPRAILWRGIICLWFLLTFTSKLPIPEASKISASITIEPSRTSSTISTFPAPIAPVSSSSNAKTSST